MSEKVDLTKREVEIAELFAWGASARCVADRLFLSERTVENHKRSIYSKTGCANSSSLSAWWFCTNFNISFSLSPLKRKIIAFAMLLLVMPQLHVNNEDVVRMFRCRQMTARASRVTRRRTAMNTFDLELA